MDESERTRIVDAPESTLKISPGGGKGDAEKTILVGGQGPGPSVSPGAPGTAPLLKGWDLVRRFPATGGEADVFLVRREGQLRILKLYRLGIKPKMEVLERLSRLSGAHPDFFVQILEQGHHPDSNRFFEVQEYFPLGTLRELAGQRKLAVDEVKRVIEKLSRALFALHESGILHLDLKPANILIRSIEPLDVVLTDFGIASILDEEFSKKMTDIKGTSLYQSPESLSGIVGAKSDWWSLGIILLELLQGKHPFDGLQRQVIYYRLTTAGIPIPTSLDRRWINILKGFLTRNPDIRWGTSEVRQWLEGSEVRTFFDDEIPTGDVEALTAGFDARFRKLEVPFSFLGKRFFSFEELLRAFAATPEGWVQAKVHIARGQIARWLEDNGDQERADKLSGLVDSENDPDRMLFKTLYTFFPELPLVWYGRIVDRRAILELFARVCESEVTPEEQKLLDILFTGDLLKDHQALAGQTPPDLEDLNRFLQSMVRTELRNFPTVERARILLFVLQSSFLPEKAFPYLQNALSGDREFQMILQSAGAKGFSDFAQKSGIWKKGDDVVWKLVSELYSRSSPVATQALDVLPTESAALATAVGKDRSLSDLIMSIVLQTAMDSDMFDRWRNLLKNHRWLDALARAAYGVPDETTSENFLENKLVAKSLLGRWDRLREYVLPQFFYSLKEGRILPPAQIQVVRRLLPQPWVLPPKFGSLRVWEDLHDHVQELPPNGLRISCFDDLVAVKRQFVQSVSLWYQSQIGTLGAFLCCMLLYHYERFDFFVILAGLCFLISTFWPWAREIDWLARFRGSKPFEAAIDDAMVTSSKSPKPFNHLNRVGFFMLVLRLSFLHPDFLYFVSEAWKMYSKT